ncbi:Phosphoglycerate mutase-like protein [Pleurostoma richardsiae]|uniref:Phosphoglycerate mutase-like protein n=1 Tax=Pleurostoma richardsiae TaxID=41990 RepID=A0AA38VNY9_9PEZI|nr:Phosphoglycerate mutase-like protein [Pleurostoma richardsiae]
MTSFRSLRLLFSGSACIPRLLVILSALFLLQLAVLALSLWSRSRPVPRLAASFVPPTPPSSSTTMSLSVDLSWHAPAQTFINNLTSVINGQGVYGFIYNTSDTPGSEYGTYNWCNMPHVRKTEYVKPSSDYELAYVELIHRHHKRTPYAANSFPVESYNWNCDDQGLYYYGQPFDGSGRDSAAAYWQKYISPVNPFVPSGWVGTCQFPQETAGGLDDSWQHGVDLYGVYHDLLGFLPDRADEQAWRAKVAYRVTNNVITSQVAGMVINGMWRATSSVPMVIEASGVDSLEPQYSCPAASAAFSAIQSSSDADWAAHLAAAAPLYATLDDISGVPTTDSGFHASFDHYYDNLSARQCHAKPLPCKLVDGRNDTSACVTQQLADEVYRLGHWEYSHVYRGASASLAASAGSIGVWIAEVAAHLRAVADGSGAGGTLWYHNVAHDGSVSRVLSVLQVDTMVWPGMGAEVVFEVWKKKEAAAAPSCHHDNCLRQMIGQSASASAFCPTFTAAAATASATVPAWLGNCGGNAGAVSSACSCLVPAATSTASAAGATQTTAPAGSSSSGYYVRVLFSGQVLKSSNPSLGLMDMLPVETLLAYFDGLVGVNASLIQGKCSS